MFARMHSLLTRTCGLQASCHHPVLRLPCSYCRILHTPRPHVRLPCSQRLRQHVSNPQDVAHTDESLHVRAS